MTIEISFADLSHTGKTVDANFFPLGCGYIASYALEHLKGQIEVQIFKYPADFSAYLEHMDEINDLSFATARKLLDENGKMNEKIAHYLEELSQYILMKKGNLFSLDSVSRRIFHYDFVKLNELRFDENPFLCSTPDGLEISFGHSKKLMTDIETYYRQYGRTVAGLGHVMQRGNLSALYRQVGYT